MIDIFQALTIAHKKFPRGPEAVAAELGVRVEKSPLRGCEGWCVRGEDCTIIRINSKSPEHRQRFTLSHELAHILLDLIPDVWEVPPPQSTEEEAVNRVAAEMLLPEEELKKIIPNAPVSLSSIDKLSRYANVSPMMIARRIVALKNQLGITAACVVDFVSGRFRWMWPNDAIQIGRAHEILGMLKGENELRYIRGNREVFVTKLETDWSTSLLLQSIKKSTASAAG